MRGKGRRKEVSSLQLRGLDACLPPSLACHGAGTTPPSLMIAIVIGGRCERDGGKAGTIGKVSFTLLFRLGN